MCKDGEKQSPIDIIDAENAVKNVVPAVNGYHLKGGDFGMLRSADKAWNKHQGWNTLDLQNKGFVKLDVDQTIAAGSTDGPTKEKVTKTFVPFKMDFKTPSEHKVNGKSFDLEV